ncbi:dihydrolipoyl dehydrogenase [Tropicimonas sp. IMCC6043]|uniref:dihydrolipoyl dehydrogenase n=1 Tax=Tropicimonas sp. IMCC6043 TaxID=2510645 RepID=UPI00101CEF9C|nr:dihydrolipoyl dehydrogenase [Tropicimonas sp. IMCC6043]RYH07312.1 dihydrolipoyl dehydrogenase [Tropicimonas sp. IMCC6043]
MQRLRAEVAIIGAGSAGMRAYREATRFTDKVLLIEGNQYGTTCARVGCMPSKLLIAAAELAHLGRRAAPFGVHYKPPLIDGPAVMRRVREMRDRFVGGVTKSVEAWPEHHRVMATARFLSDHELALEDGRIVEANRIVIATGSRTNILPGFEEFGDRMIVSDDVFYWQDLPESVAVFGAGVIGLEIGQALHRLGVRVTIFGRDHLVGPLTDPEVLTAARAIISKEMEFYPHAEVTRRDRTADGIEVAFDDGGSERVQKFDLALVATGRRPNIDHLGLENTSLERDARGVPVWDLYTGRCGDSHIFIAGDANDRFPLLHEAADEGLAAGFNAARYPQIRRFAKSAPITVVFSDPEIMIAGESFADLERRGADFVVSEFNWQELGRAKVMMQDKGLLRLYGERNTGLFLGAEMVGPRAENLAHLFAWSRQSNLTVAEMLERPFYHPVFEEGLQTGLRKLSAALEMESFYPPRCIDCRPGDDP